MPRGPKPRLSDPALRQKVLDAVEAGALLAAAAAAAGIRREALRKYCQSNPDFNEAVFAARSRASVRNVAIISRAAGKNWQAAAWWLERTDPQNWGQKINMTVRAELDRALDRLERRLPPDVFAQVLSVLADDDGGPGAPSEDPSVAAARPALATASRSADPGSGEQG